MRLSSFFRRSLWLALPATLAFSSCSDDSDSPAPDQARVRFVHDIYSAYAVPIKAFLGTTEKATLTYGQSSAYTSVGVGAQDIKITASQTGAALSSVSSSFSKDASYSVFAYTSGTGATPLVTEDNLTAPAANKAKIRIVNLGLGTPTTGIGLSRVQGTGFTRVTADATYGTASAFVETDAGAVPLFLTSGNLLLRR